MSAAPTASWLFQPPGIARLTATVGSAALYTAAFPPLFIPLRIRVCRTPALGRLAVQGLNLFARAALTMAVSRPQRMTAPVKAGVLAPYDCWAHRVAIHRSSTFVLKGDSRSLQIAFEREESGKRLENVVHRGCKWRPCGP